MGKIVVTSRLKAAQAQGKAAAASMNPKVPAGIKTSPPPKNAPKTAATSAIAPKVSGSSGAAEKNPANNLGGNRKLGNHFSNS